MTKKFYLKLLMSLMLVALVVPQLKAETLTVTVADGTDTNVSLPIWGANANSNDCESQVIYPSDELNIPAGSIIKKIEFFATGYTSSNLKPTVQVALLNTTESTVSSSTMTSNRTNEDAVIIYNGTFPYGEMTASFDCNFQYTGDNLMVDFYVSSGSTKSANTTWYGKNVSNNVGGHWKWTNASFYSETFLPKMKVTYEPGTLAEYSAKVSPESLSFGSVQVGSSRDLNVLLKNKGTKDFTYTISGLSAPFSTTVTGGTLAAGAADLNIPVTFAPTAAGTFEDDLVISFDSETGLDPITVHVTGTGSDAICDGTDYNENLPVRGWDFDATQQINQMVYPMLMVKGKLNNKKITGITFYPATVGSTSGINFYKNSSNPGTVTLKLKNLESGTAAYATTPVRIEGATTVRTITMPTSAQTSLTEWIFELDEPFEYTGGDLLIEVETTKGGYGRTYFYGVNQETNTSYYSLGGTGTVQQFLPKVTFAVEDSETPATPVITVNPSTVDAFTTEVGTPATATVNVTGENLTGDITATVSGDDAFTATLENGVLTITYNPTAAGNHTATVTLSSTGAQNVTIALSGTATAPAVDYAVTISDNTGAHNYGNVLVNSSNVWTLTITNNGTKAVTPTLSGIEAPFSTTYTATALAAGESATISINYAPTELGEHSNTITISFPEAGDAIAAYTCVLSGKAVDESYDPSDENEVVKLVTVDKRSIYEPAFIDNANGNTTPQQLNCYDMRFKMAQPDDPSKQIKAGDLRPGNNLFEFYAIDDFGTEFRFATINLFAEGQPSSNPSVNAMDAPIKVTPSVEYYTEEGMPVPPTYSHNTELKYTEKTYNDVNDVVDLEGVIDYVNDTWSANTATNSHPDHYKFQIRGVGQYGDVVTSLTAEYVESHMGNLGLELPEGWERGSWVGPNNEIDGVHTFYYYDLYIKRSFFEERGITGPVTVVVNTTLSGSGFNADNYKAMSVNGVEQIIAKEAYKDYSWTVPLGNDLPENTVVEQVPMGVIIRLVSTGADFNRTTGIYIYGGGTGVSNVETVGIYKSSMNVKAYTQKQVDEDTDRNLVAMKVGNTETANADVNVLAYADPAVTGYKLYENNSASTTDMTQVATATHNEQGSYTVSSVSAYNSTYPFVRDESLGNIDGMWLPMYPADAQKYFLPVTIANGIGYDDVVRSEGNTYGSAMQQVEKNGSVDFGSKKCYKSSYTWQENGVTYAIYDPEVELTSELPAATGYALYNYRLWVDYDDNAPAWDFSLDDGHITLTDKMDRPLYSGQTTSIGGQGTDGKDEWEFVAPNDLEEVKLVARFYYKKTSTSNSPRIKARPTDSDRLYYVVEKQVTIPLNEIVTGIDNVTGKAVAGVKYYNVAGVESDRPFQGVNIVVTRYTDGSKSTRKILK